MEHVEVVYSRLQSILFVEYSEFDMQDFIICHYSYYILRSFVEQSLFIKSLFAKLIKQVGESLLQAIVLITSSSVNNQ